MRVSPAAPDEADVPAQQGSRRNDQAHLAELPSGQQPGQRCQHGPVRPRRPRGLHPAPEHGDLMAQDHDLHVLAAIGAGQQSKPAEHLEHRKAGQPQ